MDLARVALAIDDNDIPIMLAYDGTGNGADTWIGAADGSWNKADTLVSFLAGNANGFVRDDGGCLHATAMLTSSGNQAAYALRETSWETTVVSTANSNASYAPIALSPGGDPHMLFWEVVGTGWVLQWAQAAETKETALDIQSNMLTAPQSFITVTDADAENPKGRPHILGFQSIGLGLAEVVYVTRDGANNWLTYTVIADDDSGEETCSQKPQSAEATCTANFTRHKPVGIISSGNGDVRVFYVKTHWGGDLTAKCNEAGGPGPYCYWSMAPTPDASTLRMAWLTNNFFAVVDVADKVLPSGANVRLGTDGRIHLAVYDAFASLSKSEVRYLVIGP
jgi:hypothetical protein